MNSIEFNPIDFNSIQLSSIQSNPIQANSIQFNPIQPNSIQFNSSQSTSSPIQSNPIQFNPTQFNSIQCNMMPLDVLRGFLTKQLFGVLRSSHKLLLELLNFSLNSMTSRSSVGYWNVCRETTSRSQHTKGYRQSPCKAVIVFAHCNSSDNEHNKNIPNKYRSHYQKNTK